MTATALIAEDEPLLAANLKHELAKLWPELEIVATVGDGEAAIERALALQPDVLFLDIRMPGLTGLEAARALAEDWPEAGRPFPLVVFVTAYDQYALTAFEHAAFDYVLKPVDPARLKQSCERLRAALAARTPDPASSIEGMVEKLRRLVADPSTPAEPMLRVIQAGHGDAIHMVPVDEVLYFEAADKYVRVVTQDAEHLIRLSLAALQPRLDPQRFWQIHRGSIVRCDAILRAVRDDAGKTRVMLRGRPEALPVSRLYQHLFKAM
jgi:DNA-binding LytR/AlgR family response regulator